MSESKEEGEWTKDEAKEWFESKIEYMKKIFTRAETLYEHASEHTTPSYKGYLGSMQGIYTHLIELYEVVGAVVNGVYDIEEDTATRKVKIDKQLRKLGKKIQKHEPIVARLNEAFKQTEKVLGEKK